MKIDFLWKTGDVDLISSAASGIGFKKYGLLANVAASGADYSLKSMELTHVLNGSKPLPQGAYDFLGRLYPGLGKAVSEGATTLAARTYFNVVFRAIPTVVNNLSYLTSRSVIGYSEQKYLMTHGRQYVDFGRAVLQNPAGLYTPGNFNYMHSRYTDFKRLKSIFFD